VPRNWRGPVRHPAGAGGGGAGHRPSVSSSYRMQSLLSKIWLQSRTPHLARARTCLRGLRPSSSGRARPIGTCAALLNRWMGMLRAQSRAAVAPPAAEARRAGRQPPALQNSPRSSVGPGEPGPAKATFVFWAGPLGGPGPGWRRRRGSRSQARRPGSSPAPAR